MAKVLKNGFEGVLNFEFVDFGKPEPGEAEDSKSVDVEDQIREIIRRTKEEALREAEELKKKAYEEGYRAGFEKGETEAKKVIEKVLAEYEKRFADSVERLNETVDRLKGQYAELEDSVADIALSIAEKVVARKLEEDRSVIVDMVKEALSHALSKKLTLRLNRSDAEVVERRLNEIAQDRQLNIVRDETLGKGSVVIEEENGNVVKATVENKLQQIRGLLNNEQASQD